MKIGMIMISNNPAQLSKQIQDYGMLDFGPEFSVITSVLGQYPVGLDTKGVSKLDRAGFEPPVEKGKPVPFLYYRLCAMRLVEDCDWFWQFGDDHRFKDSKGEMYSKTFKEYYTDVFRFARDTENAGVISCRGYHGGYAAGYKFEKFPKNGLIQAGHGGILYRNIGMRNIIKEGEEKLVGAIEESLCAFNIIEAGYDYYRRFNSPMGTRLISNSNSGRISYSKETIDANIQGRIRVKYNDPNWDHSSKKYPNGIQKIINGK